MVMARQMLLTKANRRALPALYSTEELGRDAIAQVRYFWGGRSAFYATEFDGEDRFFGFMFNEFGEGEWGYQSLSELERNASHRRFMGVERDMHFTPCRVRDVREF